MSTEGLESFTAQQLINELRSRSKRMYIIYQFISEDGDMIHFDHKGESPEIIGLLTTALWRQRCFVVDWIEETNGDEDDGTT